MVNLFDKKDSNKLVESITLDTLQNTPTELEGIPNCLQFKGKDPKEFAICLSSPELLGQVQDAYKAFMRCRMGDNLQKLSLNELKKVFALSCMGKKIDFSQGNPLTNIKSHSAGLLEKVKEKVDPPLPNLTSDGGDDGVNEFYKPLQVPGSADADDGPSDSAQDDS